MIKNRHVQAVFFFLKSVKKAIAPECIAYREKGVS